MKMDRKTKRALIDNNTGDRPKRKKPSDIQFASIIEKINEGFMALDAQMNYIYINKRGSEILKREPENLVGKNYWDDYPEDKDSPFGQSYLRALETQTPIELDAYYAPLDRWFENRIYPAENGLSIFFNDITERKRAEETIRQSEERFQTLANDSPVLLWVNGLEGCEFVNREYLDFLGLAAQTDVHGYDWSGFVHPDDREAYQNAYLRAFEKETVFSTEFRFRRYDGEYRWMRSEATPRRAVDGSFLGYVGASIDITVRKRAELALQKSEHQLRLITDAMPALISYIDSEYRYRFVNRTYREWFGYESEEVLGKTAMEVLGAAAFERLYPHMEAALAGKTEVFETETPYLRGGTRFIRAIYTPDIAGDGRVNGFFVLVLDITERKQAEQALAEYARQQGALYHLTDRLQHTKSLEDIFDAALDAILSALQCNRASILLFDQKNIMRFVAWRGLSDEYRKATDGHSPWKPDEKNPEPIRMNDIHTAELSESLRNTIKAEGIGALTFIPLVFDGKLIGKFMAYFNEPHMFTERETELSLTIARQLAVGIERKRDEDALRTSEASLRLATQTARMFSWEFDIQKQAYKVADNFFEAVGFSSNLIPKDNQEILQRYVHSEDAHLILEAFTKAIQSRIDLPVVQYRLLNPETVQPVWLEMSGKIIYDRDGNPERIFGVAQNITESKQTEAYIRYLNTELQAQLDEMHTLLNILPTGVWIGNHDCSEITGNPAAYQILGFEPGINVSVTNPELQGPTGLRLFVNGAEVLPENAPMQVVARSGKPWHGFEHELLFADGTRKSIYGSVVPVFDEQGAVRKVIASYTDFTERKQNEQQIAEKARLLDLSNDAIIVRDSNDRFIYWNHGAERVYGWRSEEVLGKVTHEILQTEHPEPLEKIVDRLLRDGYWSGELIHLRRDGERLVTFSRWVMERDAQGQIASIMETNTDITERKHVEDLLRSERELLERLFETMPVMVSMYDPTTNSMRLNAQFEQLIGWKTEEVTVTSLLETLYPDPEYRDNVLKRMAAAGKNEWVEVQVHTRDGRTLDSLWSNISIMNDQQLVTGIAIGIDITERKQAENRLALLAEVSELTRKIEVPNDLMYAISNAVGEHLHVRRCLFNETDLERDLEIVHRDYHNGVDSAEGLHRISDYSSITSAEMSAGKTVVNSDSKIDSRTAQDYERTYARSGERAYVAVPLMRENRWVGTFWVSDDLPRQWSAEEVSLLETIAERTWTVIEKLRINNALHAKEAELEKIINGTPFMLARCSRDLRYQFVSLAYAQMIRRTPAEITGKPIVEIMGEEGLNTISPHIERVLSGERVEYESDVLFQGIGMRSLHVVYTPDQDELGNIVGWFASIVDITERKRAEEELRESEARYRFIVENTSDGIWQIALTTPMPTTLAEEEQLDWYYEHAVIRQCNLGLARMYGYDSVEEVLGLPVQEVMPREIPVNLELSRQFIRSDYRLVDVESREMTREGRELVFLNNMIGVIEDGKLLGEWGTNRDITERKRMEDERAQLLEREQAQRLSAEQAKLEAEQARAEAERELAERKLAETALGEWADAPLPQEERSPWLRYGAAFAATLAAILVRVVLDPVLGDALALVTIYGAVAFSVWYGGVGPAILSALLGYLAITGLIVDPSHAVTLNAQNITGFALFLFSNTVVMALGESMRRAQRHAHQSARVAIERQHQVEAQLQEKQLVEASLRQSESLYRGIARGIPGGGVYVLDKDFRYLVVEGPVTDAFGLSREMLEGRTVMEVFPDERGLKMEDRLRRNFAGENVEFETQFNGRFYWTQMAPLYDSIGQTIILTMDITDRKQAEEALRRSEERFARFMQYLPGLAWIKDTDGRYIYANEAAARAFNTPIEELYGKTDDEIFPAEVAAQFRKNDERALVDEKGVQVTETLEHEDGVLHYSLVSKFPIPGPDGSTVLIGGTAFDITERKQAEEALRESEARLRAVFDGTYEYIGLLSPEGTLLEANRAALDFDNNTREDVIGRPFWETPWWSYTPGAPEALRDSIRRAADGEFIRYEAFLNRRSGETIIFDFSLYPIHDEEGKVVFLVPEGRNITERKKAEDALYESEERFRAILRQATAGIVRKDTEGKLTFVNQAFCDMLGYAESEILGKTIWELTHVEDLEENKRLYDRAMIEGIPFKLEKRLLRKDGSIIWVDVSVSPIMDAAGKAHSAVAVEVDITKRKRAEQALAESERRFREMIDALPTAIYTTDAEGLLTHFNPAAAEFSGRVPELGTDHWCVTWRLYYPNGTPMAHDQCPMAIALKEGREVRGVEAIAERPDGTRIWFEPYPTPLRDSEGRIVGGINMLVDITERKQAEAALQQLNLQLENRVQRRTSELQAVNQSLLEEIASRQKVQEALHESRKRLQILSQRLVDVQEEERSAIARELHDRVGQSLSALNINLVILDNQISNQVPEPVRNRLDDSMQLVAETITLVRDVMSDLRPPVLDDYGLEAALQSHVNSYKSRYGIEVRYERPAQPIPRMMPSVEMTFLRIAQEALINVARHANASEVNMSLKQDEKVVRLVVQDNGTGIKSWQDANRPGSHGLTIMRERAEAFGGDLKVSSIPGEGVKVEASIPLDSEGSNNSEKERHE